jgi:hypothetical protein
MERVEHLRQAFCRLTRFAGGRSEPHDFLTTSLGERTTFCRAVPLFPSISWIKSRIAVSPISLRDQETVVSGTRSMSP